MLAKMKSYLFLLSVLIRSCYPQICNHTNLEAFQSIEVHYDEAGGNSVNIFMVLSPSASEVINVFKTSQSLGMISSASQSLNLTGTGGDTFTVVRNSTALVSPENCSLTIADPLSQHVSCASQTTSSFEISWNNTDEVQVMFAKLRNTFGDVVSDTGGFSLQENHPNITFNNLNSGYYFIITLAATENSTGVKYFVHQASDQCFTTESLCDVNANPDISSIEVTRQVNQSLSVDFKMSRNESGCCRINNQNTPYVFNQSAMPVDFVATTLNPVFENAGNLFKCSMDSERLGIQNTASCAATQTTLKPELESAGSGSMNSTKYTLSFNNVLEASLVSANFTSEGETFRNLDSGKQYDVKLEIGSQTWGIDYVIELECNTLDVVPCDVNSLDYLSDITVDMSTYNGSTVNVQMTTTVGATVSNNANQKVYDLSANTHSNQFAVNFGQNYTVLETGGKQCYITFTNPFTSPDSACEAVDASTLKVFSHASSGYTVQLTKVTNTLLETAPVNPTPNGDDFLVQSLDPGYYYLVTFNATENASGIKYESYVVGNCSTVVGICNSLDEKFEIKVSRSSNETVDISFSSLHADLTVDSGNGTHDVNPLSDITIRFAVKSLPDTFFYECKMNRSTLGLDNSATCTETETSLTPVVTLDTGAGMQATMYYLSLNGAQKGSIAQNAIDVNSAFSDLEPLTEYDVKIEINSTASGIEYVINSNCTTLELKSCDVNAVSYLKEVSIDMKNVDDSIKDVDIAVKLDTADWLNSRITDESTPVGVTVSSFGTTGKFTGQIGVLYSVKTPAGNKCLIYVSNPFNESLCQSVNTSSIEVLHRDGSTYTYAVTTVVDTLDRNADNFSAAQSSDSSAIEIQNLKAGYHYVVTLDANETATGINYVNFKIDQDCFTNSSTCDATDEKIEIEVFRNAGYPVGDVYVDFNFPNGSVTEENGSTTYTSNMLGRINLNFELASSPGISLYECLMDNATLGLNNKASCSVKETTIQMSVELDNGMNVTSTNISSGAGQSEKVDNTKNATFSGLIPDVDHNVQVNIESTETEIAYVLTLQCNTTVVVPPRNLTAEVNYTSINIMWLSDGEAGDFRLTCDGQSCPPTPNINSSQSSFLLSGLKPGETYTLTLVKVISSVESVHITKEVSTVALDVPTQLMSISKNATSVHLTWTSSDAGVNNIEFEILCSANRNCPQDAYSSGSTAEKIISDLIPGELYRFVVMTKLTDGSSMHETDPSDYYFVRTELNQPDFNNVLLSYNQSNLLHLVLNPCDDANPSESAQTISNAVVFWDDSENCQNRNSKQFQVQANCEDSQITLDPLSDDDEVSVLKGSIICLNLTLISNNSMYDETSSSEVTVSLFPDSVNDSIRCNNSQLNQLTFSWVKGSGLASSFDVKLLSQSQLVREENETKGNTYIFPDLEDGTKYTFQIWAVSNELRSLPVETTCRSNIALPQFTAVPVIGPTYQIKVQTQGVYFSDDMILTYFVYNRSQDCFHDSFNLIIEQRIPDPSNAESILNNSVTPGKTYCVRVLLQAGNETNENFVTVDIPPSSPDLIMNPQNSSSVSVEMTNPLNSHFTEIDQKFFYFESNGSKVEMPSSETIQMGTQILSTVKSGAIMQLEVTITAVNGLSNTTESALYRIQPTLPELVNHTENDTSCHFTVRSGEIVQKFTVDFDEVGTTSTKNATSELQADFAYYGLDADSVYRFTIAAISDYSFDGAPTGATSGNMIYNCYTEHGVSSNITDLEFVESDSDNNPGVFTFDWNEPDEKNGDIQGYIVHTNITRLDDESRQSDSVSRTYNLNSTTRTLNVFIPLGFKLRFSIFAYNNVNGTVAVKEVTRPFESTSKPTRNDEYSGNDNVFPVERSKTSITITLPCNLYSSSSSVFDQSQGSTVTAEEFDIVVTEGKTYPDIIPASVEPASRRFFPSACLDGSSEIIVDRLRNRFRRSSGADSWTFTVGDGDGCNDTSSGYCNQELEKGTNYAITLRAFASTASTQADLFRAGIYKTKSDAALSAGAIVGIIIGILILILLILLVVLFLLRIKPIKRTFKKEKLKNTQCDYCKNTTPECTCSPADRLIRKFRKPISFNEFNNECMRLFHNDDDKLKAEFVQLSNEMRDPGQTRQIGIWPENIDKNRFKDIVPFDHRLVTLEDGYVNASYIPGEIEDQEYIATQGPPPHTLNDFWRMVWEKRAEKIVMLCKPKEFKRGMWVNACQEYWPMGEIGDVIWMGNIEVTLLNVEPYEQLVGNQEEIIWVKRTMKIRPGDPTGQVPEDQFAPERQVVQYHYMQWEDQKVPVYEEIEPFVKMVRSENPDRYPVVVHCSAGVGRTGTFMVIDRLLQQKNYRRDFDIRGMVAEMRTMRPLMVQTLEQYKFIHQMALKMTEEMMNVDMVMGPSDSKLNLNDNPMILRGRKDTVNQQPQPAVQETSFVGEQQGKDRNGVGGGGGLEADRESEHSEAGVPAGGQVNSAFDGDENQTSS